MSHVDGRKYATLPTIPVFATNSGVWFLHCHIISHAAMGMAVTIVEGQDILRYESKSHATQEGTLLPLLSALSFVLLIE
jgi:Multicopper oxidase